MFLSKRAFLGLLLVSWFPFFVRAVQFYAAANLSGIPQASMLAPSAETFRQFLEQQQTFVFFVTVYVGAGLIANDRRANALQIYLSKPLTRVEYIVGKLAILMAFLLFVTWVPAVTLLLVQIVFAGSVAFFRSHVLLFPAITVFAVLETAMIAVAMLALSSLSSNSRHVGILYATLVFFTQAIYGVLLLVTRDTRLSFLSFSSNLDQVGNLIFRLPLPYDTPWPVSLLMIAALVVVSALVLERRVRGVEIVT